MSKASLISRLQTQDNKLGNEQYTLNNEILRPPLYSEEIHAAGKPASIGLDLVIPCVLIAIPQNGHLLTENEENCQRHMRTVRQTVADGR
jgi:hypothetical protein